MMRISTLILFLVMFGLSTDLRASEIEFNDDVLPILEEHCLHCHGEDEQESGLRLDMRGRMLRGGDSGLAALVPNDPEKSYLIDVVNHIDEDMAMPPDEDKIPAEQIDVLTRWIKEGANWPGQMDQVAEDEVDHWSFLPMQTSFDHKSIDEFLASKLGEAGLTFNPAADPRALIRRVSIVLTGIAPTPKRSDEFVAAFAVDADAAYEALVDELLASEHFGERWAQHWLDVIRWAETNGSESNLYRKNAWMYRDYVVRSFNEDKPYDLFIRQQLAGDVMGAGDATGFLVAGPHVPSATVGAEETAIRQARADRVDEVLQTVGASVMGVTIGCARCHNHKFDPISIKDYYSMSAAFQDVEFGSRYPELSPEHPRVVRERELRSELNQLRGQMRSPGWAWKEDWQGYQEVHFQPKTTRQIRIAFDKGWVNADELEIIEAKDGGRNVAGESFGTVVRGNPATLVDGKPATKLTDGVFGTKGWIAKSPPKSKERPWVEFEFPELVTVSTIRISTNREDFLETDYLNGMNKANYGDFKIELRDDEGNWKAFASTSEMQKKKSGNEKRQALQSKLQDVISELLVQGPQPAFLATFIEPVDTFVLLRGSPETPHEKVDAAGPKQLGGTLDLTPDAPGPQRRAALAGWLADPSNPLTPRVMVNRIWHHTFGSGIVSTPSDFGKAGAAPTHPALLDWLANQFIDPSQPTPWSVKRMIRMMVLSKAFRQSSEPNRDGLAKDSSAQLLWRYPPRRVEAEVIRDSILQATGRLDESIGGPSYRIHNVKARYAQWEVVDNHSNQTWRRMLYQERMRRVDDHMFTAFDFPDCGQIKAKRPVSTTPLQALNLMNSDFVVEQAAFLAERAKREAGNDIAVQVTRCFELLLARKPTDAEAGEAIDFAKQQSLALLCRTLINTNEFAFLP
ncbi:MAG: PSD1 and planctomycete cytochrome C domain-containing protein [Rubripirellula sp.]